MQGENLWEKVLKYWLKLEIFVPSGWLFSSQKMPIFKFFFYQQKKHISFTTLFQTRSMTGRSWICVCKLEILPWNKHSDTKNQTQKALGNSFQKIHVRIVWSISLKQQIQIFVTLRRAGQEDLHILVVGYLLPSSGVKQHSFNNVATKRENRQQNPPNQASIGPEWILKVFQVVIILSVEI